MDETITTICQSKPAYLLSANWHFLKLISFLLTNVTNKQKYLIK